MKKLLKGAFLLTCILSLQIIKPAIAVYADTINLTYDGKQHTYDKPPISLEINNKSLDLKMPPVQIDGRTLVPTRGVFESMGAAVEWKPAEKKVFVNHGGKLIVLEAGSLNAYVEGDTKKLDVPPKIIDANLMLPLRFISETLGYKVDWNHNTSHISINEIKTAPDVKPPTIEVPKLSTKVEDVRVKNYDDGVCEYTIYLENPVGHYSHFTQEGKVVVDVDSAENLLASSITLAQNPYVNIVRTSQYTPQTTRVVFDLNKNTNSKVEMAKDKKSIIVSLIGARDEVAKPEPVKPEPIIPRPSIPEPDRPIIGNIENKNFEYTSSPQESISFKKAPGISASNLTIKDDYRNKKITVTLPGDFSHVYSQGLMTIGSSTLDKVLVTSNNKTEFTIHTKKVRAYEIIDDGENITIKFMQPKEKYHKIVLLDLGHGGKDSGATGNGLVEKELVFQQGMATYKLLEQNPSIKVYITREDDSYPTNSSRAALANEVGADIFVSLHNNSFTNPGPNGTEVLYNPNSAKGKQMAQIIQTNLVRDLGMFDRKTKARTNLLVLNQTNMPAVLVETAFLSNPGDAEKLRSAEFNQRAGKIIYDSIVEIFNTMSFR